MREFRVGSTSINDESLPYVIAELGHNHQGNLESALKMIEAAASCGVSAVKLQKRSNKKLFTAEAYNAPYMSENAFGKTYGEHREFLEFDREEYVECGELASKLGIDFFATPFDLESVDFLEDLNVKVYKIASADLKSLPLIRHVASTGKPLIMSTGGANLDEIERAVDIVLKFHNNLALLQCTAGYPPSYEELNLRVIETFRERFPTITIGYSGHDSGIAMPLVAYVLGARVIEKHFTLNRAMKGTDHAFSLEPVGMKKLIRDFKRTQMALGNGIKTVYPSEIAPIQKMGKSMYAVRELREGEVIQEEMVEMRSPYESLSPIDFEEYIGRVIRSKVPQGMPIKREHF